MKEELFEAIYFTSKRMDESLFNEVYKMEEVNASRIVTSLVTSMNNYLKNGCIPADGKELAARHSSLFGKVEQRGLEGIINDLGDFYSKYDVYNGICAAVAIKSSDTPKAFDFYKRYGKSIGENIDLNIINQAIILAKKSNTLSLTSAQQQAAQM